MSNNFGIKLKALRNNKGLTLRQVNIKSGLNYSYISLLENGKRNIKNAHSDTISKLAKGLNTTSDRIYKMAGIEPERATNSSPSETADLADPNKAWTFEGKRVSSETMKFVRRMIKGGNK